MHTPSATKTTAATPETTPAMIGVVFEAELSSDGVFPGAAREELPTDGAGVGAGGVAVVGDAGAGEDPPTTGAEDRAGGVVDGVGATSTTADGAGVVAVFAVAGVDVFSMTATKSSDPTLVAPHDPPVSPARIALPSDPTATSVSTSVSLVPPC